MAHSRMTWKAYVNDRMANDWYRLGYSAYVDGQKACFYTVVGYYTNKENRLAWYEGYYDAKYPEDKYDFPENS